MEIDEQFCIGHFTLVGFIFFLFGDDYIGYVFFGNILIILLCTLKKIMSLLIMTCFFVSV